MHGVSRKTGLLQWGICLIYIVQLEFQKVKEATIDKVCLFALIKSCLVLLNL